MGKMKPVISLSTSYLQRRFGDDGYAMLCDAAELGYEYVEIGHSTPVSAVGGILKAVSEGVVKVSSTHNFCPIPPYTTGPSPDLYSPSTPSARESSQWIRHTGNSLEFGAAAGSKALVCHAGSLSYFFFRPGAKVEEFLEKKEYAGLAENEAYQKALKNFLGSAARRSNRDYANMVANFAAVSESAREKGIFLCIENREHVADIPLESNFCELMRAFAEVPQVRAWHDVGHSMIKQLSGFCTQMEFAESIAGYQAGWHLHDCTENGRDHVAIGSGAIDFRALSRFFDPQKHIFTLELNSAVDRQDAADSLKRVQDLMP